MKSNAVAFAALVAGVSATPANMIEERQNGGGGNGPFAPANYKTDSSLQGHTIYLPSSSKIGNEKLPVFIWGNGACSTVGTSNVALLEQIASYGFIAIAEGAPNGGGTSDDTTMTQAIDWVVKNAGTGAYANVDATKIMAGGFSCGGVEANDMIWNSHVSTIGIFSSGLLSNQSAAQHFTKPILYCLGGSGDIAYANGERDFHALPANTPSWKGNLPVGHGGTLGDANGGKFGKAGLNWLLWLFKGNTTAASYFTGGYSVDGWTVETHALNLLKPFGSTNGTK